AAKPLGDIFLNLLFTAVVPLVFFSISSAIAGMSDLKKLGRILFWMILIFMITGIVSALLMLSVVKMFPPAVSAVSLPPVSPELSQNHALAQIAQAFTVPDFLELLSKKNMLALIVFSFLVGLSASLLGEKGWLFTEFLKAGNAVMAKVISLIMLYAPIGLGAYFAYLVGVFGPELMGTYLHAVIIYYPVALIYFFVFYSVYSYGAGGAQGLKLFWEKIPLPALIAVGTGSSIATVPANLKAADEIGVPKDVSRIVIPVGATIHMDGTCISAILKIAILFSFFHIPLEGFSNYAIAVGIALLSGMVMSGIPGGGFLGELLIVTLYGLPVEALPLIAVVGTLVDPPATMVNATGDNVVSMMIARILGGRHWLKTGRTVEDDLSNKTAETSEELTEAVRQ
ncbi:MAG TPA: dicarboxylate/amino acid:cation symporter, partial [bacterium]|nr:dicarboxylate/amino acid:cation symporter [bacterium]